VALIYRQVTFVGRIEKNLHVFLSIFLGIWLPLSSGKRVYNHPAATPPASWPSSKRRDSSNEARRAPATRAGSMRQAVKDHRKSSSMVMDNPIANPRKPY